MPRASSHMTIFATAMTSGVLLAMAAHVLTGRLGIALTDVWQELFPTETQAVHSALGWWMIAGAGFTGSFLAGLLAQRHSNGQGPWRGLRAIGVLLFLLLAGVPYLATATPARNLTLAFGANLAVFALGIVTAFCGSWFALPPRYQADNEKPADAAGGAPPAHPG